MQFDKDQDYYRHLGLRTNATQDEIKKKFYELAKKHHPDSATSKPSDEDKFKKITAAYDILSNLDLKRQYDAARNQPQHNPHRSSSGPAGGAAGQQGFNYNYQAHAEQTYTYNSRNGSFHGGQSQQSYADWQKTQKNDDQYNYFYRDARQDWADGQARSRRGDFYQTGSQFQQKHKEKFQRQPGGPGQSGGEVPHLRLGYFVFGILMANVLYGVLTGRGEGKQFYDTQQRQRQEFQQSDTFKMNHDPVLTVYHSGGGLQNQSKIAGSNVYNSTFSGIDGVATAATQKAKQSGGTVMVNKETTEERKRLNRQFNEKKKLHALNYGESEQDKYLQNIEEINKLNRQAGLPTIKTEVRYVKEPEPDDLYPNQSKRAMAAERRRQRKLDQKRAKQKKEWSCDPNQWRNTQEGQQGPRPIYEIQEHMLSQTAKAFPQAGNSISVKPVVKTIKREEGSSTQA